LHHIAGLGEKNCLLIDELQETNKIKKDIISQQKNAKIS
jgi:hypothetical protein